MSMDISIPLLPKGGELRPQHNRPGSAATRDNVLEYDPDDYTLVNVRTEKAQYGRYNGLPAALIVLRFIVKFRPGNKRLRAFHVSIDFRSCGAAGSGNNDGGGSGEEIPRVLALAPEERRGKIYTEERGTTVSGGLDVSLSAGADLGTNLGTEHTSMIIKEHEMRLSGWRRSSEDGRTDAVVVWDCTEARKAAKGVLPGYMAAMIVCYHERERFQAVLTLDVDRGRWDSASKLFDWTSLFGKKDTDDPLIFDPDKPVGSPVDVTDFKHLLLDDLVELKPIQRLPAGYD